MEASSTGRYGRSESGQGGNAVGVSWTGGRARRGGRSCSRKEECKRPSVEIQQEQGGYRRTGLMRGSPGKGGCI